LFDIEQERILSSEDSGNPDGMENLYAKQLVSAGRLFLNLYIFSNNKRKITEYRILRLNSVCSYIELMI